MQLYSRIVADLLVILVRIPVNFFPIINNITITWRGVWGEGAPRYCLTTTGWMTGRASEISEADERSEGSYRACLAIAYNLGTILAHLLFMACCSGNPVSFFQIYYILISGRGVWGEGVAPDWAPIEPGRMTGRAWKLTLVSEGEGSSRMMVLAVASISLVNLCQMKNISL